MSGSGTANEREEAGDKHYDDQRIDVAARALHFQILHGTWDNLTPATKWHWRSTARVMLNAVDAFDAELRMEKQ